MSTALIGFVGHIRLSPTLPTLSPLPPLLQFLQSNPSSPSISFPDSINVPVLVLASDSIPVSFSAPDPVRSFPSLRRAYPLCAICLSRHLALRAELLGARKRHPLSARRMARAEWKCFIASTFFFVCGSSPLLHHPSFPSTLPSSSPFPFPLLLSLQVPSPVPVPILCSSTDFHPRPLPRSRPIPAPNPVTIRRLFVCPHPRFCSRPRSVPITVHAPVFASDRVPSPVPPPSPIFP